MENYVEVAEHFCLRTQTALRPNSHPISARDAEGRFLALPRPFKTRFGNPCCYVKYGVSRMNLKLLRECSDLKHHSFVQLTELMSTDRWRTKRVGLSVITIL